MHTKDVDWHGGKKEETILMKLALKMQCLLFWFKVTEHQFSTENNRIEILLYFKTLKMKLCEENHP